MHHQLPERIPVRRRALDAAQAHEACLFRRKFDELVSSRAVVPPKHPLPSGPDGTVLQSMTFRYDTNRNYYYWSYPVRGSGTWSPDEGRSGSGCLRITGSVAEAVLPDETNGVILTPGNSWTVSGWMKEVSVTAGARARLRLGLYAAGQEGCSWVGDILDICKEKSLNYNYHTWHEENFGIWTNSSDLPPADPNQPLIDLFIEKQIP